MSPASRVPSARLGLGRAHAKQKKGKLSFTFAIAQALDVAKHQSEYQKKMARPSRNEVARAYAVLKVAKQNIIVKAAANKLKKYTRRAARRAAKEGLADMAL